MPRPRSEEVLSKEKTNTKTYNKSNTNDTSGGFPLDRKRDISEKESDGESSYSSQLRREEGSCSENRNEPQTTKQTKNLSELEFKQRKDKTLLQRKPNLSNKDEASPSQEGSPKKKLFLKSPKRGENTFQSPMGLDRVRDLSKDPLTEICENYRQGQSRKRNFSSGLQNETENKRIHTVKYYKNLIEREERAGRWKLEKEKAKSSFH